MCDMDPLIHESMSKLAKGKFNATALDEVLQRNRVHQTNMHSCIADIVLEISQKYHYETYYNQTNRRLTISIKQKKNSRALM